MNVSVRSHRVVLLLAALGLAAGCSWIFVQPLPENHEYGTVNCTTSRAAPVIDTIFTATNLISAAYVAGQDNVTNKGTAVGVGLSVATLWMLSAIYGYSHTSECEQAMEDSTPYRPSRRAPRAYRPPPAYYPPPTGPPSAPAAGPPAPPPPPAPPAEASAPPAPPPPPAPAAGEGAPAAAPAAGPSAPPAPPAPQQGDDEDPPARRRPAPSPAPRLGQ